MSFPMDMHEKGVMSIMLILNYGNVEAVRATWADGTSGLEA